MYSTDAWVLYQGEEGAQGRQRGELRLETITLPKLGPYDVLAEPLYGCWEANMTHAIERKPVDICRQRGEEKVVVGNAGVVRVLEVGSAVTRTRVGDVCMVFGAGPTDSHGYMTKVLAYDSPNTMGVLAKRTRIHENALNPLPANTRHSYKQWAAFSVRYTNAWANWNVAYGCWRVQMSEQDMPKPFVWGWGGGTTLAQITLAQRQGCHVAMISGNDRRLALFKRLGITPIDRREFRDLSFDDRRYADDKSYRARYQAAETTFLDIVKKHTAGHGVSIFMDYIGGPVFRATLRALGRQGVVTTAGWKEGLTTTSVRALECIQRHTHVHTHSAKQSEVDAAMRFAESEDWAAPIEDTDRCYKWDEIPLLARHYAASEIDSFFPLFQVNAA